MNWWSLYFEESKQSSDFSGKCKKFVKCNITLKTELFWGHDTEFFERRKCQQLIGSFRVLDFTTLLKNICFFFQEELHYSCFLSSLINHKKSNDDFYCPHNRNVCKKKCVTFLLTVNIFKWIFCVHIKIFFLLSFFYFETQTQQPCCVHFREFYFRLTLICSPGLKSH